VNQKSLSTLSLLITAALFHATACSPESSSGEAAGTGGSGASGGAAAGPPTLEVVHGAPKAPAKAPDTFEYEVDGYASAAGANGPLVAIGTTTSIYEATPTGISKLSIVGDEPDLPEETGRARAIAPYEDGLLVAADSGLFFTKGGVLQLSLGNDELKELGISAMTARVADDDGDGTDEAHLALIAMDGAYELMSGSLTKWTVEGESGAPTAVLAQKDSVYLAFGDRVYEVDKASKKAYPLVFSIGVVSAIACDSLACDEGSLIYFATDKGIAERGSDGGYVLYPLAKEGEAAAAAEAFAFDAGRQRLYALAEGSVVRIRTGAVPDAVAEIEKGSLPRVMAFDKLGDLWVAGGLKVHSFALGTPLSFDTDVKPIVHEYCAPCHLGAKNGAPGIDFEDYDMMVELTPKAIMRISEGTMPPLGSGFPPVPKDKFQLLQDWSAMKAK
jgi:hypothetical protein